MVRRMVGDDQEVYRVVVVNREMVRNPKWEPGHFGPDAEPHQVPSGDVETHTYGPYNSLGAAKGQLTSHTKDYYGEIRPNVISARIEKARTTWDVVSEVKREGTLSEDTPRKEQ